MTVISSSQPELQHPARFFAAALSDLRRSPAVAWFLFRSTMRVRYRRAWLQYLWLVLPTVGMTAVWVYVAARGIIVVDTGRLPYPVFVLTGMILWQVFVDALNSPLQQLSSARQVITRSRVPHEALILAGVLELLLNCGARLIVLAVVLIAFRIPIDAGVLLVPFGIGGLALLGITIGLLATPLGMLYDDVGRAIGLVTGLWLFFTPVFYAIPRIGITRFNPVTPILEATRAWMTAGSASNGVAIVMSASGAATLIGWLLYRLARPHLITRLG